jgi:hypothetical protein
VTFLWVIPATITAAGLAAVAALARRATLEADGLRRELQAVGKHRLALLEVRDASDELRAAARALRGTRG